jgi:hypothetical protein
MLIFQEVKQFNLNQIYVKITIHYNLNKYHYINYKNMFSYSKPI